ncbi:MAG: hypothetical protein E6I49_03075 [Chloroflexi bacterium]|nr:MAG: hypothetical protein E6I49_03075 [Chloroflexota bacterium]
MNGRSSRTAARTGSSSGAGSTGRAAISGARSAGPSGRRPSQTATAAGTGGHSCAARGRVRMPSFRTLRPRTDMSRTSSAAAPRFCLRMAREWPTARSCVRSAVRSGRAPHSVSTVFVFQCSRRPVFERR